jgi:hypothetical protein
LLQAYALTERRLRKAERFSQFFYAFSYHVNSSFTFPIISTPSQKVNKKYPKINKKVLTILV